MLVASRKRGRSASRRRSAMAGRFARNPSYLSRSRSRVRGRRGAIRVQGAHTFSRYCEASTIEVNGTYKADNWTAALSDLVQSADFAGLFDQYRITKVVMTFQLINNPTAYGNLNLATGSQTATNWFPKMWYVVDHDGGSTETISTIKERQGLRCRILQPNRVVRVVFKPKCRTLTYSTSTSTGYSPKNIKIDMTDTNVLHYGLNTVIDSNNVDPSNDYPFKIRVEKKLFFTCYGVR